MLYVKVDGWLSALGSTMTSQSDLWFRDEYFFCATEQQMRNSERIEMNWTWNTAAKPERTPLEDRVSFQSYFCCILLGRHQPNYCVMCQNLPGVWQQLITACSKTESWKLKSNTQHGWHKIYGKSIASWKSFTWYFNQKNNENRPQMQYLAPTKSVEKLKTMDMLMLCISICTVFKISDRLVYRLRWWCSQAFWIFLVPLMRSLCENLRHLSKHCGIYKWLDSVMDGLELQTWISKYVTARVFRIIFNVIFNCSIDLMQVAKSQAF